MSMNTIISIATAHGRKYITPEDVTETIEATRAPMETIQRDLLEIIARQTSFGVEDYSLCAYIAWRGLYDPSKGV